MVCAADHSSRSWWARSHRERASERSAVLRRPRHARFINSPPSREVSLRGVHTRRACSPSYGQRRQLSERRAGRLRQNLSFVIRPFVSFLQNGYCWRIEKSNISTISSLPDQSQTVSRALVKLHSGVISTPSSRGVYVAAPHSYLPRP